MLDWVNLPEWLTEARVAIIISILSATFTGLALPYTRRLALNDTARMKRKPLVFEKVIRDEASELPGWSRLEITARNLEPVAANIIAIKVKRRRQMILSYDDAFEEEGNIWGERTTVKKELPALTRCVIPRVVNPLGTAQHPRGFTPSDTAYLSAFVKGVDRVSDIEVEWRWADGKKR